MVSTAIPKTSVETQPQDNIFSIINNRTYIKDPRNPTSTTADRVFVYEADPFIKAVNFEDYPYIVVEFPMLDYERTSTNGKVKNIGWKHQIIVRALQRGSSNVNDDVGRNDILQIADDLHNTFNSETVKAVLRGYNMFEMKLSKKGVDTVLIKERPMYEFVYELNYYTRMVVSD